MCLTRLEVECRIKSQILYNVFLIANHTVACLVLRRPHSRETVCERVKLPPRGTQQELLPPSMKLTLPLQHLFFRSSTREAPPWLGHLLSCHSHGGLHYLLSPGLSSFRASSLNLDLSAPSTWCFTEQCLSVPWG